MESLICELHLPELNEPSEQSSVQAHSAWQRMSGAGPRLGSVLSLEISALYDSVPSRVSRAELALLTLPSLAPILRSELRMRRTLIYVARWVLSPQWGHEPLHLCCKMSADIAT